MHVLCFFERRGKMFGDKFLKFILMCLFVVKNGHRVLEWQMGVSVTDMSMGR